MEAGDLVPANPGVLDGAADLTGLTYLNEPSILHGLALRYAEDAIYTHAGPVLIALNPFRAARCPLEDHSAEMLFCCGARYCQTPSLPNADT